MPAPWSAEAAGAPATTGPRFLEAIWRYYNLVDFAVSMRDSRASVGMRLAYDDADGLTRNPQREPMRASFQKIAQILSGLLTA